MFKTNGKDTIVLNIVVNQFLESDKIEYLDNNIYFIKILEKWMTSLKNITILKWQESTFYNVEKSMFKIGFAREEIILI